MLDLGYDVRIALRSLLRRPGFAFTACLTLALGLGASIAVFSVLHGILLQPLSFPHPEALVSVSSVLRADGPRDAMSEPDLQDLLHQSPALATLVGYDDFDVALGGAGEPELVRASRVTDGLMATFLLAPTVGRDIRADECGPGGPRVAVISYGLWRRRFDAAADVLDRSIELNGRAYQIVGVAAQGFEFPEHTQVWVPHRVDPASCGRACHTWLAIGRLAPGATVAAGQLEAAGVAARLAATYPQSNTGKAFRVEALRDVVVGKAKTPLWILFAAVLAVLLIATANVGHLLLIRASARTEEVAVRAALGASRSRLVAQLVLEGALVAIAGGVAGVAIAVGAVQLLRSMSAGTLPRVADIGVGAPVVLFALGLVLVVILLLSAGLAAYLARNPVTLNLVRASRGADPRRPGRRSRSCLIGLEAALSVLLLVGAGLLVESFARLSAVRLGFDASNLTRFTLSLPFVRYGKLEDIRSFCRTLEARLAALPGVDSVGSIYGAPLGDAHTIAKVLVEGRPEPVPGRETTAAIRAVSPHYLETMRIPLLAGRTLEEADDAGGVPVGVVNQAFVRQNFRDEDPLGKKVRIATNMGYGSPYWQIVGVVADIRSQALAGEPVPEIYVPHGRFGPGYVSVNVRSRLGAETLVPAIRSQVRALDAGLPLQHVETVAEAVQREVAPTRFYLLVLLFFAVVALVLTAVGVSGVLGFLVSQRTHEIGIRVAMGAERSAIVLMIAFDALVPILIGTAAGLGLAVASGRIMAALVYGVSPWDPIVLAAGALFVLVTALLGSLAPVRRAGRVDPMAALRAQ